MLFVFVFGDENKDFKLDSKFKPCAICVFLLLSNPSEVKRKQNNFQLSASKKDQSYRRGHLVY